MSAHDVSDVRTHLIHDHGLTIGLVTQLHSVREVHDLLHEEPPIQKGSKDE